MRTALGGRGVETQTLTLTLSLSLSPDPNPDPTPTPTPNAGNTGGYFPGGVDVARLLLPDKTDIRYP